MADGDRDHPEEGTIHAWLDGALSAGESEAVSAHVATCADCGERVAEARGLIAGASRVVAALDDLPAAGGVAWGTPSPAAPRFGAAERARTAWRRLRVTPARAAIAATLLVAVGISLTYDRTAVDSEALRKVRDQESASRPTVAAEQGFAASAAPGAGPPGARDALLDSALKRNIAQAQPPRAIAKAPGLTPPTPEPLPGGGVAAMDITASAKVAEGRASARAARDTLAGRAPDLLTVPRPAATNPAEAPRAVAGGMARGGAAGLPSRVALLTGTRCYRVESANATAAMWGPEALPLVVAVDSGSDRTRVYTASGARSETQALVVRGSSDSLLFTLRRQGYDGTLALGSPGEVRAGVMRSRPTSVALADSGVETAAVRVDKPATGARTAVPQRKRVPSSNTAAAAAETRSAMRAAPAIPVVATRVRCP